jgi:hypothetical protein
LLPGSPGGLVSQQITGDERVPADGGAGQAEDQGQAQRVRPGGQRFVGHPAAADAPDADAVPLQVPVEVAPADRSAPPRIHPRRRTISLGEIISRRLREDQDDSPATG